MFKSGGSEYNNIAVDHHTVIFLGMRTRLLALLFLPSALEGCERDPVEVSHPFYLWHLEDPSDIYLFRCVDRPPQGCAVDGLPGPGVSAAGADKRYIVVKTDHGFYYFGRSVHELSGWGNDPEKIIGPLNDGEFKAVAEKLRLPALTIQP